MPDPVTLAGITILSILYALARYADKLNRINQRKEHCK